MQPFYTVSFVLLALVFWFNNNREERMDWLFVLPLLTFLWTAFRDFARRFTVMTIGGGKLRFSSGMLSRSTRTMELAKIQDVTVNQSLLQRMLNIGTLRIETAGESIGLIVEHVDRPQAVADFIMEASGK